MTETAPASELNSPDPPFIVPREQILERIAAVLDEVRYLEIERAHLVGGLPPAATSSLTTRRRGRPKSVAARESQLHVLYERRAALHAAVLELRGETNHPGFEALVRAGIVSRPREPTPRGRGRPAGREIGDMLRFWVGVVRAAHEGRGKRISIADAVAFASEIIRRKKKPTFSGRPEDYYREIRRLKTEKEFP